MEIRNLGGSGLRVSAVGIGCNNFGWHLDTDATRKVIHKAMDVGITLFDTADVYGNRGGSETAMGEVLGDRRKDIVLATKFAMQMDEEGVKKGASRRYIMKAVEESPEAAEDRLHRPVPAAHLRSADADRGNPARAAGPRDPGQGCYIGCSNLPAWRVAEAAMTAKAINVTPFSSIQDEYSLVVRDIEKELQPAAKAYNLGILPYFPLASGLLTGKYAALATAAAEGTRFARVPRLRDRYVNEKNVGIAEKLKAFASERGHSMLELAFSWLASLLPRCPASSPARPSPSRSSRTPRPRTGS